jgi:hypothetical protein
MVGKVQEDPRIHCFLLGNWWHSELVKIRPLSVDVMVQAAGRDFREEGSAPFGCWPFALVTTACSSRAVHVGHQSHVGQGWRQGA